MKYFTLLFIISFLTTAFAIGPNQWDNFQGGTTQGWTSGVPNPNPPVVVPDGGPSGAGDAYLKITSTGSSGAGSKLITFNGTQWAGNYTAGGITVISMFMNNFSSQALSMRVAIQGPGGNFWSSTAVSLQAHSGWQSVKFSLVPANLTGGADANATLSGVTQFRILHSAGGGFNGDVISAVLGIDNITAASEPLPVELSSFAVSQNGNTSVLKWTTASEKNNYGFEIQKKIYKNNFEGDWVLTGFKKGAGTTTEKKDYFFTDNLTNTPAEKISYRLKQIDFDGRFTYSPIVDLASVAPSSFSLSQNYPNPFNPTTSMQYAISSLPTGQAGRQFVSLKVYDLLGNEVTTLVNEMKEPGDYKIKFDASKLSSGIYFYELNAGSFKQVRRMLLLK